MTEKTSALTPGFAAPVHDAQRVFRAVLDAMARPIRPQPVEVSLTPPAPLSREAGAVVLALCDEQTPLWLDDALRQKNSSQRGDVEAWIRFHTGARIVDSAADALFCVASGPSSVPSFDILNVGTDEEPHLSATVIIEVAQTGRTCDVVATGPGIDGSRAWDGTGVPLRFLEARRRSTQTFPRGVDVLLAGGGAVRGLPRTTILTEKEDA